MKSYLFIGGPADGERIAMKNPPEYYKVLEPRSTVAPTEDLADDATYSMANTWVYSRRAMYLADGSERIWYQPTNMNHMEFITRLLSGYFPQ